MLLVKSLNAISHKVAFSCDVDCKPECHSTEVTLSSEGLFCYEVAKQRSCMLNLRFTTIQSLPYHLVLFFYDAILFYYGPRPREKKFRAKTFRQS